MRRLAMTALVFGFVISLLGASPTPVLAVAPSGTPTLVSPADGSNVGGANPILNWTAVSGAVKYRVQVASTPSFSSTLYSVDTGSLHATPTSELPDGTIYWRVAGMDASNQPGPFATATFTKSQLTAPAQTSPTNGQTLHFPSDPLLFTWQAIAGASSYTLQISNDAGFTTPSSYTTVNTSYALTDTQAFAIGGVTQSYYWRVQASVQGQATAWSSGRSYQIDWGTTPTLEGPANHSTGLTDLVFSWTPVLGAGSYELQISSDITFSSTTIDATVKSTRYVPYPTLANGSYYWRVRAIASGTANNLGAWSSTWDFTRSWSTRPVTISPHWDGGVDPLPALTNMELTWTPAAVSGAGWVDHADHYEVQISTTVTFTIPTTIDCFTNHTTFSIYTTVTVTGQSFSNPCTPGTPVNLTAGLTYYWRVRGIDSTKGVQGEWDIDAFNSAPQRFTFDGYPSSPPAPPDLATWIIPWDHYQTPECVDMTDPATNRCVPLLGDTQELAWDADPYATTYVVWIAKDSAFTTMYRKYKTQNTTFTPRESWLDSQAGEAYYWFIQPCEDWNLTLCGPDPTTVYRNQASAYRKFSQPADAVTPLTTSSSAYPPVEGTTIADQVTFNWGDYMATSQALPYPAEDPEPDGSVSVRTSQEAMEYEITVATASDFNAGSIVDNTRVDATQYTPSSKTYPEGPLYWKVQAVDGSGNELAVSQTALVTKASAPISLVSPLNGATVTGVPYLTWNPQNWAYKYTVEVYKNGDTNFSSANKVASQTTYIAAWTPTSALDAGVYAWRVQRLDRDNRPGPWSTGRTFSLLPGAPTLIQPADQAQVGATDILFTWTGPSNAVKYRFQTSTVSSFTGTTESQDTVMPAWSPSRTYSDGTYYWRVSVLDASNHIVSTSGYRTFTVGTVVVPPVPSTPSTYHPITPVRLLDTRVTPTNGYHGRLKASTPITFQITGRGGVPSGASAVTGNLTVTGSTAAWAVYLGPSPIASPSSSTINFVTAQTIANGLTVALSSTGTLSATYMGPTGATTDLVFDVTGYYTPDTSGQTFHPITPVRDVDTRIAKGLSAKLRANTPACFTVAGVNGVPGTANAVNGIVTVADPTSAWALYLGPLSTASPTTSTLNFLANQVASNNVTVALDGSGKLCATYLGPTGATTHLVFDVTGYFTADASGASFVPIDPVRLLDTRHNNGLNGKFVVGTPRTFAVTGRGTIPTGAAAVTGNLTVTDENAGWAIYIGPDPLTTPPASSLNFVLGDVKANGVSVALSGTGTLSPTYLGPVGATTSLVFDCTGYFVLPT